MNNDEDPLSAPVLRARGQHFRNHPEYSHRGRLAALMCVAVLVVILGAGGFAALRLRSNVTTETLNLGPHSSPSGTQLEGGPLDILVLGSDTRGGKNAAYGNESDKFSGARSDVMMLLQISENRKNVSVVSFPRDLIGTIPKCTDPKTGKVYPEEHQVQINESLSHGGPGCTVATISEMTGITIDHFMLVDFNAVKELSKVVGGVEVCVTSAIDDEYSGLDIPAGTSKVKGEQALAFLRSRHGFGDGSDTGRIQAQQAFLASLLRKVKSEGTLNNPGTLYHIAEAITQNVTVDQGLTNPATLVGVGRILAKVDLSRVVFATVPTEPYPPNPNKLQLAPAAEEVFAALRADQSLAPEPKPLDDAETTAPSTSTASEQLDRSVPVSVFNGTGKQSRGAQITQRIEDLGYSLVVADPAGDLEQTQIQYSAGYEAQAQEIAAAFGVPASRVVPGETYAGVAVLLGSDFAEGDVVSIEQQEIVGGASGQTAEESTCQQAFQY